MTGLSKAQILTMMTPIVSQVQDAPFLFPLCSSKPKRTAYSLTEQGKRLIVVSGGEDHLAVPFDPAEFKKRGNVIFIPTSDELKLMFLSWLKTN